MSFDLKWHPLFTFYFLFYFHFELKFVFFGQTIESDSYSES